MTARAVWRWRDWPARLTIRARLTLWSMALLAVILLAFSSFLYLSLARSLQSEADSSLAIAAQQLLARVDIEGHRLDDPVKPEQVPASLAVAVYNRRAERLLDTDAGRVLPALSPEQVRVVQAPWTFSTVQAPDSSEWRLLTAPILEDNQPVGALQVAHSQAELTATLRRLLTLMALAIPATLVLAGAGGLFLAGRALGPIDRMTRTAQAIGADDLTRRLDPPTRRDEVGRLALTFNQMLDRLERAFRRQRQFVADASHELRTPLAMLASQLDVLLARPQTAAAYRQALVSLREDVDRLNTLVNELLTLARADAGQHVLQRERLDLAPVVEEMVDAMESLAETRGLRLIGPKGASVPIEGDQTRLTQLAINLLDNALRYTPAGGVVTVAVRQEPPWAVLEVTDTGIGIAPEHLPHLFERFYRVDPARARAAGGAGLGLAISHWIVQAHGGQITVASQPGQGTTVTVRLPLAAPAQLVGRPEPGPARA